MKFKNILFVFFLIFLSSCLNENEVNNIIISSDDYMRFDTRKITVKSEKLVKLTLNHTGVLDAKVMGHNFVLLKKNVDVMDFANRAALASENEYIPIDSDEVIVYTEMIGGGQVTSIEFMAPEIGVYDFICSFPGHFALMKGKLNL